MHIIQNDRHGVGDISDILRGKSPLIYLFNIYMYIYIYIYINNERIANSHWVFHCQWLPRTLSSSRAGDLAVSMHHLSAIISKGFNQLVTVMGHIAWCGSKYWLHGDVIKWKHFPRYWPFVRGIHQSPVNSPHKGQWRGALMFSLICVWINGWVNNCEAGDLRRYRAQYDVTLM